MHERSQLPTGSVTNKLEDVVAALFFRVSMIASAHFLLQTGSRETFSGLIQVQRKSVFLFVFSPQNKTIDLPCFPFRSAVFIRLKSLFATRFKLCKVSFV